ncbi:hypothetical protein MLD38_026387 [Melastoma candidum]|uniref:Uncharacterized protein n=1 Tax=Melastoma candidum TaxID=119954 RepID=A0ACB9P1Y2_9MYRT|nr:hypothetical protein MLD38_026387 [Melastoma candidum]
MAALKLYGHPMSSCTARVMICLVEKNVEFELVHVDPFSGQHKSPDFLTKNPFGLIPVLEDGDFVIIESRAITEYICKKYAGNGTEDLLRSDDLRQSTRVRAWVEVESHCFQPVMSPIIYQSYVVPLMRSTPDEKAIEDSLEKLRKVLDIYEARLGETKYLAGDAFSLADLHHLPYMFFFTKIERISGPVLEERPRVKAWWEEISSRAAFKEVSKGMKLEK